MSLIAQEEPARRLARAILTDLALYNAKQLARGAQIEDEVQEGRELYQTRVKAPLHPLFEEELVTWREGLERRRALLTPTSQSGPSPSPPAHLAPAVPESIDSGPTLPKQGGSRLLLVAAFAIVVLLLWFSVSRL